MTGNTPINATVLCRSCDAEIPVMAEVCPACGVRQFDPRATSLAATSERRILPAAILAFFFGIFGAHRFYVGRPISAIFMILTLGGIGIWAMVDFILIVVGAFKDGEGRKLKEWT